MRILVIANGEEPPRRLLEKLLSRCDRFFAADGGGNIAIKMGYTPDLVIGDMDSFIPPDDFSGEVIRDDNQETNDLEKVLLHARSVNAERIDILGATGKRLDHTLKNLSVMQQFNPDFSLLSIYDAELCTRILPKNYVITLPPDHPVSLFPLSGKVEGIRTEGLKYPLRDEFLENGRRDGSSNETTDGPIRITHRSGSLLFMTKLTDHLL